MGVQLPGCPFRSVPPLLVPDIGHPDGIAGAAGGDEWISPLSRPFLIVLTRWHESLGEMLADIVLGKRRHGGVTLVDRVLGAGVESPPRTIGVKLIERCLQDIEGFFVIFR